MRSPDYFTPRDCLMYSLIAALSLPFAGLLLFGNFDERQPQLQPDGIPTPPSGTLTETNLDSHDSFNDLFELQFPPEQPIEPQIQPSSHS